MKHMLKTVSALAVLVAGGCATTPYLDRHMGEAVQAAGRMQVANPQAPAANARTTMDAQTAVDAIDNYHEAGKKPAAHGNAYNIGVGTD